MFQFRLFGIPVTVEPFFWLITFILGRGLQINSRADLLATLLWMIVVFVSILVHELGHALTSRKLVGGQPYIRLWAMGGLAYPNKPLTRLESRKVSVAGPLAGFALALLTAAIIYIRWGQEGGTQILGILTFGLKPDQPSLAYFSFLNEHWATINILNSMIWINFWWSIVNLLPVLPLDGGRIFNTYVPSMKKTHRVGFVASILAALFFLSISYPYGALLFGFFAYQNYQGMQHSTGDRWH